LVFARYSSGSRQFTLEFNFSIQATKNSKKATVISESENTNSSEKSDERYQTAVEKMADSLTHSAKKPIESSQEETDKAEEPHNSTEQPIESSLVEIDKTEIWNTINGDGIVQTREMVQQGNIAKEYDSSSRLVRYENSDLLPPTEETNEDDWIPSKDVWQSFQSEYADQIANLGDFVAEGIAKTPSDDGWFFNMVRPIGQGLHDRVILWTTRTGQVVTLQVFYADLDSVPSSFVDYVQNAIEEYVAENEPDAVSYEPDISYEKLEDGRIIARCSLIFQYSDGSSWGENISIVSEDPYY